MSDDRTSWVLVVVGGVVVGLLLVVSVALALWLTGTLGGGTMTSTFESNGAQIYYTGTSQRGTPVTAEMGPGMGRMRGPSPTCASCHGPDGRGGDIQMMMRIIEVPDIRYESLTSQEHGGHGEEDEEAHEPYTEATVKRAISEGVEPNGEPLEWPMPRWSMSDQDLDDLVDFLRTLD